jgi:hypothetical protein
MSSFDQQLAHGQLGESIIAKWCMSRGNSVLPVYEKEIDTGKGPRFFTPRGRFAAPDMFVMPAMNWIEAKHKTVFSWHRKTACWCTGIDLNHYEDYKQVQETSSRPVWLLFLHRSNMPDQRDLDAGCPKRCPVGLFGGSLAFLEQHENHRHDNWGRHGMVYWAYETLKLVAPIDEIDAFIMASVEGETRHERPNVKRGEPA